MHIHEKACLNFLYALDEELIALLLAGPYNAISGRFSSQIIRAAARLWAE